MKCRAFLAALAVAGLPFVAGPGAGDAAAPATLNVVVIPTDSAAQVFYAQDLGYFKAAGLDVHISTMTSSPPIIAALAGGGADIGNSVVGSAVAARSRGIAVSFLAPAGLWLNTSPTGQLAVLKGAPLHNAADFTGKTIAVTGLADLTYYAAKAWLDNTGGSSANVKFVELSEPEMVPALKAHRVDGAILIEPFVAAAGDDITALAPADDEVAKRFLATGWLASDAWLQAHPDLAARYAAVMKQTADWANTHRKESAEILLRYTKLTPEITAKMVRATYGTTLDVNLMQPVIDNAAKYGNFPRPVTASELIWTRPK
jgi:NitT/TauT family transport system substrate-binding protein